MAVRRLVLRTNILLCPDFRARVNEFVPPGSVDWMGGVTCTEKIVPRKDSGKPTRLDDEETSSFHLVRKRAIIVTTVRRGSDDWIVCIELNPALALYGKAHHPLDDDDLTRAHTLLKQACGPLLRDSVDVRYLVPGEVGEDEEPVADWRSLTCEVWYPRICLAHLRDLSHPKAGSSRGRKPNFARLVPEVPGFLIHFERAKRKVGDSDTKVPGLLITLELADEMLTHRLRGRGTTAKLRDKVRVVHLGLEDVRSICREVISELGGYYLPPPPEWTAQPGVAKLARMIALVNAFTGRTPDELLLSATGGQDVCARTAARLTRSVPEEMDLLKPLPLSEILNIP